VDFAQSRIKISAGISSIETSLRIIGNVSARRLFNTSETRPLLPMMFSRSCQIVVGFVANWLDGLHGDPQIVVASILSYSA
jgi:hypothetical protein